MGNLRIQSLIKNNKGLILLFLGMAFFRTAVADWNYIPSGSMEPNLYEGDWVLVSKTAYGPSIPFANTQLFTVGTPQRGDIVTFVSPHTDELFVKRIIGIPGDVIQVSGRDIFVNGKRLSYKTSNPDQPIEIGHELVGNKNHLIQYSQGGHLPDIPQRVHVPEGKYFAMGDHRNNSADSRYWGFVDGKQIMGKVTRVALSFSKRRELFDRFFIQVD